MNTVDLKSFAAIPYANPLSATSLVDVTMTGFTTPRSTTCFCVLEYHPLPIPFMLLIIHVLDPIAFRTVARTVLLFIKFLAIISPFVECRFASRYALSAAGASFATSALMATLFGSGLEDGDGFSGPV